MKCTYKGWSMKNAVIKSWKEEADGYSLNPWLLGCLAIFPSLPHIRFNHWVWPIKILYTTWFSPLSLLSPAGWQVQATQHGTLTPKGMVEPKVEEAWITKSCYRRLFYYCDLLHEWEIHFCCGKPLCFLNFLLQHLSYPNSLL